uniref:Protein ZIP4 homolog n=2 Tax=Eptatretus burgeri TaxID=7764 RepID=A0A8C4ND92_EPTBU
MDDTFPKIEVLINNLYDLKQKRDGNFEASVKRVLNMLMVLEKGLWRTTRGNPSSFTDSQVEKCSLQLWNWAVAENTLSTISDIDNAKFRHVACKLLTLSDPSSINERRVRLQIEMCLNAAQAWIVCGRYEMTDDLFELARTCIEKLLDGLAGQHHSLSGSKRMMLDRDLFSIDGLQFQCVGSLGEHDKAVIAFNCVRDKLALHPKEAPFLAMVCYNLALKFHKEGKLEECTYWLRQSYDTGKAEEEYKVDSCQQAKTLRFLAHVCLQWEAPHCWINALNAIELAIKEQPNVPGFLLYMKILTLSEAPDTDLISAVQKILKHNLPSDLVFNAVRMVMQNGRESACKTCLPFVCESLSHTTCGLEVILLKMEVALHFGNEDEAKKEAEDLIAKHHSGKMLKEMQQEHMHLLLWGRASFHIEAKCYADALVWYELSASFYAPGKLDCNLAKLYRNLATCYLELHRLNKAKESLSKAHRIEPDNPTTIFLNLRVALFEGDEQNASHAMDCLVQLANQEKDSVGRLESLPAEDQETPC